MIHAGRTAGRERFRNGANSSNVKPQSVFLNLNNVATEVPALQGFAVSRPALREGDAPAKPKLRAPDLLPGPWPVVCFASGVSRRIYVDLGGVRLAELMWK
jgi:hypothetical protein